MKNDALRNFTVRFRDSALQRVEMKAKPFYGGRLSTGEAIRRLAEERLAQIEKREPGERETLLAVLRVWRSGRRLSIADLRFIANAANTVYRRCRRDFVSKELLLAQVNAFREVAPLVAGRMSGSGSVPAPRPFLGDPMLPTPALNGTVGEAIDAWIARLSDLPSPGQAEYASRNLLAPAPRRQHFRGVRASSSHGTLSSCPHPVSCAFLLVFRAVCPGRRGETPVSRATARYDPVTDGTGIRDTDHS